VEVVATASEYVPTTVSHPGHSYTNCHGSTYYFGQFNSYGNSGSVTGTAETNTQCSSTFSPPTEGKAYERVNYTIVRGEQTLYLLSCTQTRVRLQALKDRQRSMAKCLAFHSPHDVVSATITLNLGVAKIHHE
jgi:hypothetical protein